MPLGLWNQEWLGQNAQRRYPLSDDSSGVDTSGSFRLPGDFLVNLDLPIAAAASADPSRFFLRQIGVYATGVSLLIGYQPVVGTAVDVATALIPGDTFTPNRTYALAGVDDFADTVGTVTIGKLSSLDEQPAGLFTFVLDNARIEPDCVRPQLRGFGGLYVRRGQELLGPFYGDIELVAESNCELTPSVVDGTPQILISAVEGAGLAEPCVCADADAAAPPIYRVNNVTPTAAGDLSVIGDDCLQITTFPGGIKIEDACSKPCCGCEELEAITRDLESFGAKFTTLENFLNRLEGSVQQTSLVVLGSRLNDNGCTPAAT